MPKQVQLLSLNYIVKSHHYTLSNCTIISTLQHREHLYKAFVMYWTDRQNPLEWQDKDKNISEEACGLRLRTVEDGVFYTHLSSFMTTLQHATQSWWPIVCRQLLYAVAPYARFMRLL